MNATSEIIKEILQVIAEVILWDILCPNEIIAKNYAAMGYMTGLAKTLKIMKVINISDQDFIMNAERNARMLAENRNNNITKEMIMAILEAQLKEAENESNV